MIKLQGLQWVDLDSWQLLKSLLKDQKLKQRVRIPESKGGNGYFLNSGNHGLRYARLLEILKKLVLSEDGHRMQEHVCLCVHLFHKERRRPIVRGG
jgi:hypothetical protein